MIGAFFLLISLLALYFRIRKKETRDGVNVLMFCWVSLLCVFGAGVLVLRVRAIYYFVWYLLVPFSAAFLMDSLTEKRKTVLGVAILLCGALNFVFNFYPDLGKYSEQLDFFQEIDHWMQENQVRMIYGDYQAPTIAAFSKDAVRYSSVFPNLSAMETENGGLLVPNGSPVAVSGYQNVDPDHAVLVLSESPYDTSSGYRYLQERASEEYKEKFENRFSLEIKFDSPYITYYVYSFEGPDIFPEQSIP